MRDYWGFVGGTIPRFVYDELPFKELCCNFTGYMKRFEKCGCCCYERDEINEYMLRTPCPNNGEHKIIVEDTSFATWSCNRSKINEIHQKIREIEINVPIKSYVYLDEDHKIKFTNHEVFCEIVDEKTYDLHYKIFSWIFLMELLLSFNHHRLQDRLTFVSECI
jgi:hypothetical protein